MFPLLRRNTPHSEYTISGGDPHKLKIETFLDTSFGSLYKTYIKLGKSSCEGDQKKSHSTCSHLNNTAIKAKSKTKQDLNTSAFISNNYDAIWQTYIPNYIPAKSSLKPSPSIYAFAANTTQGVVRNYNEDRVSIIFNNKEIGKDNNDPKCAYFAIFDGHGGSGCADFLKENLHNYIIKDKEFATAPKQAIMNGIAKAESIFTKYFEKLETKDSSGSCMLIVIIIGKLFTRESICYVANVGDSRAIISSKGGKEWRQITTDHRPMEPNERKRIISYGGSIYRYNDHNRAQTKLPIHVPFRVMPGRLSVSRTIGDIESKESKYSGKPNVISSIPDVFELKLSDDDDFILLGCDGIFEKLSNEEIVDIVIHMTKRVLQESVSKAVDAVIKYAALKGSLDNLTVIIVYLNPTSTKDQFKLAENTTYPKPLLSLDYTPSQYLKCIPKLKILKELKHTYPTTMETVTQQQMISKKLTKLRDLLKLKVKNRQLEANHK